MIELTEEQRSAVEQGDPIRVMAPDLGKEVVVLRADLYDTVRELLEEERQRRIIARIAMRNAATRMNDLP